MIDLTHDERRELYRIMSGTRIEDFAKVPRGWHCAILVRRNESVYIPGDERSRTNPGHGYGEETRHYSVTEYHAFTGTDQWKRALELLYRENPHRKDLIAFEVERLAEPRVTLQFDVYGKQS